MLRNVVVLPYSMLLTHDIAAYDATVFIDYQRTVATLANGGYIALWHTMGVVSISELIEQLLLHVVGYNTFIGNSCPEVLVSVDVYDVWCSFYTHATVDLLHVALKVLALWVVDAEACCRLNP